MVLLLLLLIRIFAQLFIAFTDSFIDLIYFSNLLIYTPSIFFVDVTPNCVIDIIGSNTCFIVPTCFL